MANPESTTDYPTFAGTLGKQDLLRNLWAARNSPGKLQGMIFRVSNTDFTACVDGDVLYSPNNTFAAAVE